MKLPRRALIAALGGAGTGYLVRELQLRGTQTEVDAARREADALRATVARLSYNVASGGGVNRWLVPDPTTGEARVALEQVFSFDRNHAMCRVDTNPAAFKMRTYQLGEIVIEPHHFSVAMVATTIERFVLSTSADGKRRITLRGGLSCATEVGHVHTKLDVHGAAEHAAFEIEAVDGGVGGGKAGDAFAITVFFDPKEAPVDYSIFGPRFTFTGEMVEGEITIVDPAG